MIWYFIAGFIAGAVGVLMYGRHVLRDDEEDKQDEVR